MPEPRASTLESVAFALAVAATLAPGTCWLIYAFLVRQFAPIYHHPSAFVDYLAVAVYSLGLVFIAPAGIALHRQQASRAGVDERIGLWVLVIGAMGAGVGDFGEDGLGIWEGQFWVSGLLTLLVGLMLFGIGTMRARVLPLWCGALLALSPVVALPLGGLFSNWPGTFLFGLIWIALGFTLVFHQHRVQQTAKSVILVRAKDGEPH